MERIEKLRAIAEAAAAVVGTDRIDRLKDVLRDRLRRVVPFDAFTFALYDSQTGMLHFEVGRDGDLELPLHTMPVAGTPSEQVVRSRRALLTLDSSDPHGDGASISGRPVRSESIIRVPILTPADVLGVISVQSYTPGRYTPEDVELVETVATVAATAILNIRHLEELRTAEAALRFAEQQAQQLATRMRAVADMASRLIQTRSIEQLQTVVRGACERVIPLNYCALAIYDHESGTLHYERTFDAGFAVDNPRVVQLAGTPCEHVIGERRSLLTRRADDPAGAGSVVIGTGRRSESIIRAPVLAGDRVLGVLTVQSYTPELYGDQDVEVLEALAALAATAILNIEHLHQHQELEAQLRQAQKMEAVGQLAGGVAHDFNNLLTAIEGNTALVLSELPEDHPCRPELQDVQEAAARAASLTRQLLAFGRQQVLRPRVLDLNSRIEGVQTLLRRLIPSNIGIQVDLAGDLGQVRADESQIDQVLLNLAVNARDAMHDGGDIVIATRNVHFDAHDVPRVAFLKPGPYVVLEVTDSGVGMDAQTLTRVFDPFFSTKPLGRGTGLGLATVYGIVRQSGGSITATSVPGEGSTFTVYLPRLDKGEEDDAQDSTAAAPEQGHETVLLVEDEAAVRSLARRVLERRGYRVIEAENGADALRVIAEEQLMPDVLLTDIMMPVMAGDVLAERLRAADPLLPIVFMSGYAGHALAEAATSARRTSFVQKPFTPQVLTAAVRAALDVAAR